jgi:flagellar biosynthesis regulator FlaF
MTIDGRLEALAQAVELMAGMQAETERHTQALTQSVELIAAAQTKNDERMGQLMETMTRLGNIVIAHEQRIEDLESRGQQKIRASVA